MKSCSRNYFTVPFFGVMLLALFMSQFFASSLLAEEFTNISDIKACRAIGSDKARLICYDTVIDGGIYNEEQYQQVIVEEFGSEKMPKSPVAEPAPAVVAVPSAAEKTTRSEPVKSKKSAGNRLSVTIVRVKKDANGYHYFQTSDGQVWKQQNAGSWNTDTPFDAVIRSGTLSSFFLENEAGRSTRVKRLR